MNSGRISKVQILALSITAIANVSREDMGRYSVVKPAAESVRIPQDTEIMFFDRTGRTLTGKVVNKREDIACGKFPQVEGIIVDTKWNTGNVLPRKRMAQGGITGRTTKAA